MKNGAIFLGYGLFSKEVDLFMNNMDEAEEKIIEKNTADTGITDKNDSVKKTIAKTGADLCCIARSYAAATDSSEPDALIHYTQIDIEKQKEVEVLPAITCIHDALMPLVTDEAFVPYGITDKYLDDMLNEAKTFNNILGGAAVVDAGSAVANKSLNELISDMNGNVKQPGFLIHRFNPNDPKFVAGFGVKVRINESGVHHSGFAGTVKSVVTGEVISGAQIVLEGTKKKAISQPDGTYELIKMRSKLFRVIVTAEKYEPKSFVIKIQRGKILPVDISL